MAATILDWNSENLLTGEGPERPGGHTPRYALTLHPDAESLTLALNRLFVNRYVDLPMPARIMVFGYLCDHFEGHDGDSLRATDMRAVLGDYFGPILARQTMDYAATMALTASLTAAAYVRLGEGGPTTSDPGEKQ